MDPEPQIPPAPDTPPRDDLVRGMYLSPSPSPVRALELRASAGTPPTMFGHFAVFDRWSMIDSLFEGRFMERIAPGAFKKTIQENLASMRVLFQHGMDPMIGDKPLGGIDVLREDDIGAYYESPLLEAPYVRDNVLPGLAADLYGASFRFQVVKEEIVQPEKVSDYNPEQLPERTIREARVFEFGPVTFPAYPDASAGVRSLTDRYTRHALPRAEGQPHSVAMEPGHKPTPASRTPRQLVVPASEPAHRFRNREEFLQWIQKS